MDSDQAVADRVTVEYVREAREPPRDGGQACEHVPHRPLWPIPFSYRGALARA